MTAESMSWSEHAAALEGEQAALAALRAVLSPIEQDLESVLDLLYGWVVAAAVDEDDDRLGSFQAALGEIAIEFGLALHGDQLDAVLAARQAQLAQHIAEYQP